MFRTSEMGIYKRKQEKKEEIKNSTKKVIKKKRKFFLFSWSLSWSSSCFLTLFSFIKSHLRCWRHWNFPASLHVHSYTYFCMYVDMHICIHVFIQLRTEKVIHPVELASREIGLSGTTFGFRNEIIPQFLAESWQGFLCSFIKPSTYICIYINICITLPNLPTHTRAHILHKHADTTT